MTRLFVSLVAITLFGFGVAVADPLVWSFDLRPANFVAGQDLQKLKTRRAWNWQFDEQLGKFEIAVRKSAFPVPAPKCQMDYLILLIPLYYPESPKQAPLPERRAVYDAIMAMQTSQKGALRARVEALDNVRQGRTGPELTSCNIYFVLPLAEDAARVVQ